MTYLPTKLPAQFYGLPDGKVFIIYSRFYEIKFDKSDIEFVFAEHKDFQYDYSNEQLIPKKEHRSPVYNEMVDNPNPKIKIVKVYRDINSYAEAYQILNKKASKMHTANATPSLVKAAETRKELVG